jgi:DNA polymerase-3 subunit delta
VGPGVSVRDLEEGLQAGTLSWLILGDASLLVDRAVERLVAWGRERCGPPQFNLSKVYASEANATSAFSTARTLPMMAGLRIVVVRELDQADDAFWEALVSYLAEPSPSTLLVCAGSGFPKAKKGGANWSARVQKVAVAPRARILKLGSDAVAPGALARQHAKTLGKDLGENDARLLVDLVGGDLGRIVQEIEKLALYVGDAPKIGTDDVHAACSLLAEAVVWDLTAGIASKNPKRALAALHRMLEDGEPEHKLMALVVWQLREVLQIGELIGQGRNDWDIAQALRSRADRVREVRASLSSEPDAARMMERVARANQEMNSHRAGTRRVFEALIVDLCA